MQDVRSPVCPRSCAPPKCSTRPSRLASIGTIPVARTAKGARGGRRGAGRSCTRRREPGEELGDLLFSCVNVARLCGKQPELLLRSGNRKVHPTGSRPWKICLKQDGKSLEGLTLREMDVYWEKGQSVIRTHLLLNPASGRRLSGGVFPVGNFSR